MQAHFLGRSKTDLGWRGEVICIDELVGREERTWVYSAVYCCRSTSGTVVARMAWRNILEFNHASYIGSYRRCRYHGLLTHFSPSWSSGVRIPAN